MDDQQRLNLKGLIEKLRKVTLAVQIMPFVYTALYVLCMILYFFAGDNLLCVLDSLFYVSPTIVIMFFILSKQLRLCKWHRRAILLPLIPQIAVIADRYLITMSKVALIVDFSIIIIMAVLLLVADYNVFLK